MKIIKIKYFYQKVIKRDNYDDKNYNYKNKLHLGLKNQS